MSMGPVGHLSPWWRRAVIITMVLGFSVLALLMVKTYTNAPPVPERVVASGGQTVLTGADIDSSWQVCAREGFGLTKVQQDEAAGMSDVVEVGG